MSILSLSFSPFALVFLGALYGVVVLLIRSVRTFMRTGNGELVATKTRTTPVTADARGIIATALAALALLSEVVFLVARPFLGDEDLVLFMILLLVAAGCGILAVIISSLRGFAGVQGWSYVALGIATLALSALSIWLISPALLRI